MFDVDSSPLARRFFIRASMGAMAAGFAAQASPALAQTASSIARRLPAKWFVEDETETETFGI
ncbi:hypothetical protein QA639_28690 [Bradyrhizobium pachyrhizi]|uniref:hypothetical protein n=1 Tax=Bradyrhizobium pachyrhizi TaxID=280333 RepID=UPI0024B1DDF5|nr:hypothetical protein [Bradyrhizobium pachyrhizi]WFU53619.1 hypothetical protein QA639_28690 [Bradyrhizobium pachyrhizi]